MKLPITASCGDFFSIKVEVFLHEDNIWLTHKKMADLFNVSIPTINEHLKNIFSSGELKQDSVIRKFLTTASDGKKYQTNHYNLDAITSLGYRVNSKRATQFRIWAKKVLKHRLKNKKNLVATSSNQSKIIVPAISFNA